MFDRIRSSFSGFEPRNIRVRDVVIFLGVVLVITFCGGGALVISQLSQQKNNIPTPVPSPTTELASTPLLQVLEALATATIPAPTSTPTVVPTVVPTAIPVEVITPTRSIGESCIYSDAWINKVATPIPDGGFSKFQGYLCDNGYWDLGIGDWVNSTGDWGNDGSLERAFVKFNGDGVVIDRMFYDLHGNKIPGPHK